MNRWTRTILSLFVIIALASCSGDSPNTPGPDAHVGTYTLVTFNGNDLPAHVPASGADSAAVLSGTMTLNSDGTASDNYRIRVFRGWMTIQDTIASVGTYNRNGTSIQVQLESESRSDLTFDFNEPNELSLTTADGALFLLFRK